MLTVKAMARMHCNELVAAIVIFIVENIRCNRISVNTSMFVVTLAIDNNIMAYR